MLAFKSHILCNRPYVGGSTREINFETKKIYKLSSNENLLGSSPMALKVIQEHLHLLHEYYYNDDLTFREALACSFG
jgi:histidinol-phosphate aminotransferase